MLRLLRVLGVGDDRRRAYPVDEAALVLPSNQPIVLMWDADADVGAGDGYGCDCGYCGQTIRCLVWGTGCCVRRGIAVGWYTGRRV